MSQEITSYADENNYLFDTKLEPYRDFEEEIATVMIGAVSGHNGNEIDGFGPLEHDTTKYPFQRADCTGVIGNTASYDQMKGLAPIFFPKFEEVVNDLVKNRFDMLSAIAGALEHGSDVTSVTDHRQVIGVAILPSLISAALYRSDEIEHGAFNTEIMVSSMLKYTRVHGQPAFPLMQSVFSATRAVFPAISKSNKSKLPEGYASVFNTATREARSEYVVPRLSAVAPGATRDVFIKKRIRTLGRRHNIEAGYYLAPPSDGTIDEFLLGKYVLPSAIDLSDTRTPLFLGKLRRPSQIRSNTDAITIMQEISDGISDVSGVPSFFVPDMDKFLDIKSKVEAKRKTKPQLPDYY